MLCDEFYMASAFNKAERRKGLREAPEQLEQLRQKWPKAFSAKSHEVRPLAAGTTKTVATEFGWSYQYARAVLERWKLRNDYCRAVLAYQKRYTLEGKESDELVDERAKMLAREMIENRQARRQRQAAKEQGTRIARLVEDLDDETIKEIARSTVSSEHAHLDNLLKD